jgi:hypothetical protein
MFLKYRFEDEKKSPADSILYLIRPAEPWASRASSATMTPSMA